MKTSLKKVVFAAMFIFTLLPFCARADFCSCFEKTELPDYVKNKLKDRGMGDFSKEVIEKSLGQFSTGSNNSFSYGDIFSFSSTLCQSTKCIQEKNYKKSLEKISETVSSATVKKAVEYAFGTGMIFVPADLMKAGMYDLIDSIKKTDLDNQVELYFEAQKSCSAWQLSIDQCHEAIIKCSEDAQKENGAMECAEHKNLNFYLDKNSAGFLRFVYSPKQTSSFPKNVTPKEVFGTAKILYEIENNAQNQSSDDTFLNDFSDVLKKSEQTNPNDAKIEENATYWDAIKAIFKFLGNHTDLYWTLVKDHLSRKNIYSTFVVEGIAMNPTYKDGDYLLVQKMDGYKKDDVIAFKYPKNEKQVFIKRITDIPNKGEYFVMGDNRDYSSDSRTWGTVPENLIKGKVIKKYNDWPF